jgi:hypothetical protein
MANITRNFIAGRMNKSVDERLLPDGEYIDAMNVRMGSTEQSEIGVIENTKGNSPLTSLSYIDGTLLSNSAKCIGAIEDSATETIYWFVHDPAFTVGATGKLDMIVSFNVNTNILTYHVISINDGNGINTTLNFNPSYLITGVDILDNKLLFFTDDYNAPRVINVTKNYPNPVSNIDAVSAESLLVIKKPPVQAPAVQPIVNNGQEDYLETRFICFAYRYKYSDGEYSATSQWSAPAFAPKAFNFSIDSFLNEGMTNFFNSAVITYNTGGPLVVGIDLLFKRADGNVIRVIEKLDKQVLGLTNNSEEEYTFTNNKIFTILSESELLRLYDNVPRFAKAQTIMGNRLMYGNYVEGYDLVDVLGQPVQFEYQTSLVSSEIGVTTTDTSLDSGNYSIDGPLTIADSIVSIDLDGKDLVEGSAFSLSLTLTHSQWSGDTPFPTQVSENIRLSFAFFLSKSYNSVYELATSVEFQDAIGDVDNIEPVDDACNGITFTDQFNCALPNNLGTLEKIASGISGANQAIAILTSPSSNEIGLQIPAMKYVDDPITPTQEVYEYYRISFSEASFQEIANTQSLHSNRDYEIGIVYMDDFNRATTAQVSPFNTEHIPCGLSSQKNSIYVTIPFTQRPPVWATRYKFVIKPDEENYETIYCNLFFEDPNSNSVYFLLEGENARKVEVGDRLIVKADSEGPTSNCVYATILEKTSESAGFIEIPKPDDPTEFVPVPAGVYVKINPNSFNIVQEENAIIAPGVITVKEKNGGDYPILFYPMNIEGTEAGNPSTWTHLDYDVPSGSRIVMSIKQFRAGAERACEERRNTLEKTFISANTYDNMYEWFVGEDIEQYLNDSIKVVEGNACEIQNDFEGFTDVTPPTISTAVCTNYYKFYRNTTTNELFLMVTGTESCRGIGFKPRKRDSNVQVNITVFRADNSIIFETEPSDALPDVFFENEMSFPIVNGNHQGNIQNQNIATQTPAIIDTKFFNCFAFGNGAESYKIRDSITGASFNLGNRVTSVSAQDYKAADRFADITYSGVYSAESKVNMLNEFNLGLINFKVLEPSFGDIQILDARANDILVLQEDKISYVLSSKNLISDSTGGGVIASVPEVLGNQITRIEKYGISANPESYVQWGPDRFFTDVKRGAVLNLKGDDLIVISELGMRTWFRDEFIEAFDTQKLGGYDPFLSEYVLSTNDIKLPVPLECVACGVSQTFTIPTGNTVTYCVDLGQPVGTTTFAYSVPAGSTATFSISVTYDGVTVTSGVVSVSGSLQFNKAKNNVNTASVTIVSSGALVLTVVPNCPVADILTIINVTLTSAVDSGQSIHNQYRYTAGTYVSPLQSTSVTFAEGDLSPVISQYDTITGPQGFGGIPTDGASLQIISNNIPPDTFNFVLGQDKFRYIRTNTLYPNTSAGMTALLAASAVVSPITGSAGVFSGSFIVPNSGDYLYLVWDYRNSLPIELCYSSANLFDACCECSSEPASPTVLCFSTISSLDACCGCEEEPT